MIFIWVGIAQSVDVVPGDVPGLAQVEFGNLPDVSIEEGIFHL